MQLRRSGGFLDKNQDQTHSKVHRFELRAGETEWERIALDESTVFREVTAGED